MCEFCTKHGDGKKWYLDAKNYSEDLLSDLRRQKMIRDFFQDFPKMVADMYRGFDRLRRAPRWLSALIGKAVTRRYKREHFGQVIPREDVLAILDMCSTIVRVPCICRRETVGKDAYYCLGITLSPGSLGMARIIPSSFLSGPDARGIQRLRKDEAARLIDDFEKEGLMHSVWTFRTPFIGGLCNCDLPDCLAMQATVTNGIKVMFKAEYVAQLEEEKCTGCRACMRMCQFGAMGYSATRKRVMISLERCYGCGVCRAACPNAALSLAPRASLPAIANSW
jgi:ferredoxin